MASKISALEGVLNKLSLIPGLTFLASYVTEANMLKTQVGQTVGDYQAYLEAAQEAAEETAGAFDEEEEDDEEEDDEEEEEDEDE